MSKPRVQTSPTSGAWLTPLAASTPGSRRSASMAAGKNAARWPGAAADEPCTDTESVSTPRGSKPGSIADAAARLRSVSPAPISSTSASAISETTSTIAQEGFPPVPGDAARGEAIADPRPRRLPRRDEAEHDAGQDGEADRERQRPALDGHVGGARQIRRRRRGDQRTPTGGDRQADDAAQPGEQQAFRQQLADDLETRRAERQAHGDLGLPRRRAGQQHVRDVGAGDQQDEADGDEQHREAQARVADDPFLQRHDADVAVGAREGLLQARRHQIDVGLGGGGVDARFQPGEDPQAVAAAAVRRASSGSGAQSSDSVAQNGAKTKRGGITPTIV